MEKNNIYICFDVFFYKSNYIKDGPQATRVNVSEELKNKQEQIEKVKATLLDEKEVTDIHARYYPIQRLYIIKSLINFCSGRSLGRTLVYSGH